MSFHGHIENGVVVFDEPLTVPDGTPVRVEVIAAARFITSSNDNDGWARGIEKYVLGAAQSVSI